MMYERGDFSVKDEPFARCYYFSDDRVNGRRSDIQAVADHRFEAVTDRLWEEAQRRRLFVKDHAYHVAARADAAFLAAFSNTFLIRHPSQSLPSLYARMPDFTLEEAGYEASYRLFERVRQIEGRTPVIIDADDLVDRPSETVRAYCDAVGIPFLPGPLNWKVGVPAGLDAHWWGDASWHTHLENSSGFARQPNPGYVTIEDNAYIREACHYCLPFYSHLHEHRLRVS
jgi:hypothetical protein